MGKLDLTCNVDLDRIAVKRKKSGDEHVPLLEIAVAYSGPERFVCEALAPAVNPIREALWNTDGTLRSTAVAHCELALEYEDHAVSIAPVQVDLEENQPHAGETEIATGSILILRPARLFKFRLIPDHTWKATITWRIQQPAPAHGAVDRLAYLLKQRLQLVIAPVDSLEHTDGEPTGPPGNGKDHAQVSRAAAT